MTLQLAIDRVAEMNAYTKTQIIVNTMSLKEAFEKCSQHLDYAISELQDAQVLLGKKEYLFAINNAQHMKQSIEVCQSAFNRGESPFEDRSYGVWVLGDAVVVFLDLFVTD
ncbi:hypothetical protein FRX31_031194 [Thalictrum thalictroides]|uniref:Pectinesterase inhibitor domain-containing protein n=1 Tax=Thalictrum thalictroides TaxID=46969 RepID=A0A7J6V333_THATH|nr:hypothetical protein FRX31_031194 [Thalictrum thalictroides]